MSKQINWKRWYRVTEWAYTFWEVRENYFEDSFKYICCTLYQRVDQLTRILQFLATTAFPVYKLWWLKHFLIVRHNHFTTVDRTARPEQLEKKLVVSRFLRPCKTPIGATRLMRVERMWIKMVRYVAMVVILAPRHNKVQSWWPEDEVIHHGNLVCTCNHLWLKHI